ncbi:hypothetical protein FQR65_LT11068 [Abscondita terminalis]|nr:hypothetical protein FQR65_LT11068 [Abscondita terminalis]
MKFARLRMYLSVGVPTVLNRMKIYARMFGFNKNDAMRVKHLDPDSIKFSIFTNEDVKKLSVIKISTPLTFDALGYPLSGGLYDRAMGPLHDQSEPCATCNKNIYFCPGHFGHIELPLTVVNPLFHKTVGSILKMTCLSCFHIQIPVHIKYCLSLQIKLLNHGLTAEALDIEVKIQEGIDRNEEELEKLREYETTLKTSFVHLNEKILNNKNTESLRNDLIASKTRLKSIKKCIHCRKPFNRIQATRNRIVLNTTVSTEVGVKLNRPKYVTPEESRKYLQEIWDNEKEFLLELVPVLGGVKLEYPTDALYFDVVAVTPSNVRPAKLVHGRIIESEQSQVYKMILQNSMLIRAVIQVVQNDGDMEVLTSEAKAVYSLAQGKTPIEKLNNAWEALQLNVDELIDKDNVREKGGGEGLKQIIEKKAGLIRMHMMGKRVNFSARSVITPDPNLNIDEIGVPEEFAKHLTYPIPVTSWNVIELRKMIINGPNVHPGAVQVEFEDGTVRRINPADSTQQESIVKRLLTPDDKDKGFTGVKKVHRHLCNGDVMLLNRQPTLHKPSIMAHTARILKGEKTFRLHYANCKAYNADFDGDEMNAHFPQNELARSEGYNIAHVCNQYLVPKDGTPLSGLIQDHIISGVRLSMRGRFFSKYDYQQMVYQAVSFKTSNILLLPPALIKPYRLWSGKQVLSTIILNVIPQGRQPINLTSTAKIGAKAWVTHQPRLWKAGGSPFKRDTVMSEAEVVIRNGELLVGVLDKTHYGATPFGLVHCIYELYGGACATKLLSSFAKLFTYFLQRDGFTLGVQDILVLKSADKKRKKTIRQLRNVGIQIVTSSLDIPENSDLDAVVEKLEQASERNAKMRAIVDREYKTVLDPFTNEINKACLPAGLISKFPNNNLQLMVQSGAKGSTVNTMQISCLLGQIELEGKRPPLMISGKSLPSFPIFEFSPRAGGFIDGRFMTGIQPQEFFFHCMAGREGLIDTAVKTSRSGYLQRCLIKHLEGLSVGYDLTVRDSDRCVVQFLYGEDGMDVTKTQFLNKKQIDFLMDNRKAIINKNIIEHFIEEKAKVDELVNQQEIWEKKYGNPLSKRRETAFTIFSNVVKDKVKISDGKKISSRNGRSKLTKNIIKLWTNANDELKSEFKNLCPKSPDPLNYSLQPDVYFGALSDDLKFLMDDYGNCKGRKQRKEFNNMLKLKAMQSLCAPGEAVGLLAAQSIGEPSTQMTLNTFHFAGRGEMNVTLGIPRLREILMMASKKIKTPSMEIPFLDVPDVEKKAGQLRKKLTRVTVADILEKIEVVGQLEVSPLRQMTYKLKFVFLPHELYKSKYNVKPKGVLRHMTKKYFGQMFMTMKKYTQMMSNVVVMEKETVKKKTDDDDDDQNEANNDEAEESDKSDGEPEDLEDAKLTSKHQQVYEAQEPEDEENVQSESDDNEDGGEQASDNIKDGRDQDKESVVLSYNYAQNYTYDKEHHLWCELTFALPLSHKKMDLSGILREVANKSVIFETPNIKRAITYVKDDRLTLRTDGINIIEMFKYHQLLDLNKLYSNDIHQFAETYGVEAATKVIVKEVQDVFKVYGIVVDPRHLTLIADYMMFNGNFEPLSRKGLSSSSSPLQQMSFESSLSFLKQATINGKHDYLQSPSSCLIVGKPCHIGTGERKPLYELQGKTVAIDLSCWVCEAQNITDYYVQPKMYLRNLYFRTCYLLLMQVRPVFVLEGKAPELKLDTITQRNAVQFKGAKPRNENTKVKCKDRSRFNAVLRCCEEMLSYMGIACVKGLGEAESLCAYLNEEGLVHGCITQDSDCFAYGAKIIYRNFSISQQGAHAGAGSVDVYDVAKIMEEIKFGRNKMIAMALLCGSDYCNGVFGVGKEAVIKLFEFVPEEEILERLRSWKSNFQLYTKLEKELNDKNVCTSCGHFGKLQSHVKNGCKQCTTLKGCDFTKFKNKRLEIKHELSIRSKALQDPNFPNEELINEYLTRKDNVKIESTIVACTRKKFAVNHLQWEYVYAFEKFLPILTRWQLTNGTTNVLTPSRIKAVRNRKGVQSYEIIWNDTKGLFKDKIPDNEPLILDVEKLWSTVEPQHLVLKAYPELTESFERSKKKTKKKNKTKDLVDDVSKMLANTSISKPKTKTIDSYFKKAIMNNLGGNDEEVLSDSFNPDLTKFGDESDLDLSDIVDEIVGRKLNYLNSFRMGDCSVDKMETSSFFMNEFVGEEDLFERSMMSNEEMEQDDDEDSFDEKYVPLITRLQRKT